MVANLDLKLSMICGLFIFVVIFLSLRKKALSKPKKFFVGLLVVLTCFSIAIAPVLADVPDQMNITSFNVTHKRGNTFVDYEINGYMSNPTDGFIDIDIYNFLLYTISDYDLAWNILNISNGIFLTGVDRKTLYQADNEGGSLEMDSLFTSYDEEYLYFSASFSIADKLLYDPTGLDFNVLYYMSANNVTPDSQYIIETENFVGTIDYSLEPSISFDSQFYNNFNTRIQYSMDGSTWIDSSYDTIVLDDPEFMLRVFDIHSNEVVYQDGGFANYSKNCNITIVTVRLVNNAGEPVYFHLSNATTTYNNVTYFNSPTLINMFVGSKNSSDYSCLDYDDFDSLLLEPAYTPKYYDNVTESWYSYYDPNTEYYNAMDGEVTDMQTVDGNVRTVYDEVDVYDPEWYRFGPLDYVWNYEMYYAGTSYVTFGTEYTSWFKTHDNDSDPYTVKSSQSSVVNDYEWSYENSLVGNSYYTNGSASGPYSNMNVDDLYYYNVTSGEFSIATGYELSYENRGIGNSYYIYGTPSGPYSYMDVDDLYYYNVTSDEYSSVNDYEWTYEDRVVGNSYYTYGSPSGSYSDMNADDLNYYNVISNESSVVNDYEWSMDSFNPYEAFWSDGSSSSPYSYMNVDDYDYYVVSCESENTVLAVDYVWWEGNWVPVSTIYTSGVNFTNGTTSDPLTDVSADDTDYYIVRSNTDSVQVDFVWDDGVWNPTSSAYVNGTATGSYSNMNSDDSDYYIIDSEWEQTISDYHTRLEQWYVYYASMFNGTTSGTFPDDIDTDDSDFYEFICNTEFTGGGMSLWNYTETASSITMTDGTSSGALSNFNSNDGNYVTFDPKTTPIYTAPAWDSYDQGSGAGTYTAWTGTYADWDEAWYSDTDYVYKYVTGGATSDESIAMGDSALTTTYLLTAVNVDVRYKLSSAIDVGISVYIYIDGTWDYVGDTGTSTSFATSSFTKTYNTGEDIADYNNMQVRVNAWSDPFEGGGTCYVSCTRTRAQYKYVSSNQYDLDGYAQFDYTDVATATNITARSDIQNVGINYRFYSSVAGTDITCYAYNWDTTSWTSLSDSSPTAETEYYKDLSASYVQNNLASLLIRFRIESDTETTDFLTYFDLLIVELEYDNQNEVSGNYYHYIDGYFEWDLGDLITNGNMTDKNDLVDTYLTFIYLENSTYADLFDLYVYNWDTTSWILINSTMPLKTTQTTYTNSTLFDDTDYWSSDLKARLRIVYEVTNTTDYGIKFYTDLLLLNFTYTNKLDPYWDWYHYIDGYVNIDISDLHLSGEIVSRDDFEILQIDWIWETNISDTVTWYVYDWDSASWDEIDSEIQTSFDGDYSALGTEHINPSTYIVRIRFVANHIDENTTINSGIQISIDELDISGWYEDHNQPTYDFYHYIDGYFEISIHELFPACISAKSDIEWFTWNWIWKSNISNTVNWSLGADGYSWDLQTSSTQIGTFNYTTVTYGWPDFVSYISFGANDNETARLQFKTEYSQSNVTTSDGGIQLEIDHAKLHLWFENQSDPTFHWIHLIDGGFNFDIDDLVSAGNITNYDDIIQIQYGILWAMNVTEATYGDPTNILDYLYLDWETVDFDGNPSYYIDWIDMTDGFTDLSWNLTTITYDIHTDLTTYAWTNRLTFGSLAHSWNSTDPYGIQLLVDYMYVNITYENHHSEVYYNWTYNIDGYLEWDLTDLVTNGNITDESAFQTDFNLTWIWKTNISSSVNWTYYNWDTSSWDNFDVYTTTSFITNSSMLGTEYLNDIFYLLRLRFISDNFVENTTTSTGNILLSLDYANLFTIYENLHSEVYNWTYNIDGYLEWDLTNLVTNGNITDESAFQTDFNLTWIWKTNISSAMNWTYYNWDTSSWDNFDVYTTTSFITNSSMLGTEYLNDTSYLLRLRFISDNFVENTTTSTGNILLSLDYANLYITYENLNLEIYNWTYKIDGYLEWDLTDLVTNGNITDESAFQTDFNLTWIWKTNISSSVNWTYYNWDTSSWDNFDVYTTTSFITNSSMLGTEYLNDTSYLLRLRFISDNFVEDSSISNGSILLIIDYANLFIIYENLKFPVYNWTYKIDGYLEWNLSSLYTNGNISSESAFQFDPIVQWIWQTNISVDTAWYCYDWSTTSWILLHNSTETTYQTNSTSIDLDCLHDSTHLFRLRFVTNNTVFNSTISTGNIQLDIDYSHLYVIYQDLHQPTYRFFHALGHLFQFNLTELYTIGNITEKSNIQYLNFTTYWRTNMTVPERNSYYGTHSAADQSTYNFYGCSLGLEWDVYSWGYNNPPPLIYGYQNFITENNTGVFGYTIFYIDLWAFADYDYNKTYIGNNWIVAVSCSLDWVANNLTVSEDQTMKLELDLVKMDVTYENHYEAYYDWNVSAQLIFDYDSLPYDWDWVHFTDMRYEYYMNDTLDDFSISFNYNITEYTNFTTTQYLTSTLVENLSQSIYYANNTGFRMIMNINATTYNTHLSTYSGMLSWYEPWGIFLEYTNISVTFGNQSDPFDMYWGFRDPLYVVPYDYINNIMYGNYPSGAGTFLDPYIFQSYNVSDVYGNFLTDNIVIPSFSNYIVMNYTPPQMRTCLISFADQRGEYLDFLEYKTKIDGTTIYEPYFYKEVNDTVIISVYDRFNNFISNTSYTVQREDNWVSINITLYSLKIYNQQESFIYFNLTQSGTAYYWSEWMAPNEITDFRLISGNYSLNVTTYEDNETINNVYDYEITADELVLVDSKYNLLLLSDVYHMCIFSNLTDWSNVYNNLSQIKLYEFVNAYTKTTIEVLFRHDNDTDSIIISAGNTIKQILPLNLTNYIEYKVINAETGEKISGWKNLPLEHYIIVIGSPEITEPITPQDLNFNSVTFWGILVMIIIIIIIIVVTSYYIREKLDPKQKINRDRYDTKKYKRTRKSGRGKVVQFVGGSI